MAPSLFRSVSLLAGINGTHAHRKVYCHPRVPADGKSANPSINMTVFSIIFLSLLPPLVSVPTSPTAPPFLIPSLPTPETLTLACLSGLLPCIPPSPVWPQSQEVAQLVDKHHGNGEGGSGWWRSSGVGGQAPLC